MHSAYRSVPTRPRGCSPRSRRRRRMRLPDSDHRAADFVSKTCPSRASPPAMSGQALGRSGYEADKSLAPWSLKSRMGLEPVPPARQSQSNVPPTELASSQSRFDPRTKKTAKKQSRGQVWGGLASAAGGAFSLSLAGRVSPSWRSVDPAGEEPQNPPATILKTQRQESTSSSRHDPF